MTDLTMLDLLEEQPEETAKPRRISGYDRMKLKVKRVTEMFTKDIAALENLVGTLLNHLEHAIRPDITDADRDRYRQIVRNIRAALEE